MIIFWCVAALFLAGALLMLLPALWRPIADPAGATSAAAVNLAVHRDQLREARADLALGLLTPERFERARAEIQRRVLEDTEGGDAATPSQPARRTALALALLIPLASIGTYLQLGQPDASAPVAPVVDRHSVTPEQIQRMVAALAERLRAEPADAQGWLMLGRSYTALGRYGDAATAYRRGVDLLPPDAGLLADLADVTGMAQGKRLGGEPARLIQRALDLDPRHVKALALAGSVAFESKDYAAARGYWERLVAVLPADSPMLRSARGSLAEVVALESGRVATASPAAASSAGPAAAASRVSGEVVLGPDMAARVAAGDTLFVFARAAEGPRMPLAIVRQRDATWPFRFTLDDSMAMSPALRLSAFTQVVVSARVSRSGNATPQPGDLVGQSAPVAPGAEGLRIVIDQVQP